MTLRPSRNITQCCHLMTIMYVILWLCNVTIAFSRLWQGMDLVQVTACCLY